MNAEKFTEMLIQGLNQAKDYCEKNGHQEITPAIVAKILIEQPDGLVKEIITKAGEKGAKLSHLINDMVVRQAKVSGASSQVYFSPTLQDAFNKATTLADGFKDSYIATDTFFLALLETAGFSSILKQSGLTKSQLITILKEIRKGQTVQDQNPEGKIGALDKYTRDITKEAREGKLDPVIGRDEEIRRTIQVLSRRTKNNPVLIGEPGVGKTAIAEGIALRISKNDVPDSMRDKRLLSLDLPALLAGSKFRGELRRTLARCA